MPVTELHRQASRFRNMLRTLTVAAAAMALLSLWVAPLGAAEEKEAEITVQFLQYSPASLTVETGTTVVWRNKELFNYPGLNGNHQVRANDNSFESPVLGPGESFALAFNEPGTFAYACVLHPQTMKGSVQATGDPVKPPPSLKNVDIKEGGATSTWGYNPKDVTLNVGDTVRWRNTGGQAHTVTAQDGSFDSGSIPAGETFELTFTKTTSLTYFCEPHPWMTGTIRVAEEGKAPPPPPPAPTKKPNNSPPVVVSQPTARPGQGPMTVQASIVEPNLSDPMGWGYSPATLNIRAGDTIVWTNAGATAHTVTATDKSFDSGMLDAGKTFKFVFSKTGTFAFSCTPHPWMKGTVAVAAAGSAPVAPAPDQPGQGGTPAAPGTSDPNTGTPDGNGDTTTEGAEHVAGSAKLAWSMAAMMLMFGVALILGGRAQRRRDGDADGGAIYLDDSITYRELEPV